MKPALLFLGFLLLGFGLRELARSDRSAVRAAPRDSVHPVRRRPRRCPLCGARMADGEGLLARQLSDGRILLTGCRACGEPDGIELARER